MTADPLRLAALGATVVGVIVVAVVAVGDNPPAPTPRSEPAVVVDDASDSDAPGDRVPSDDGEPAPSDDGDASRPDTANSQRARPSPSPEPGAAPASVTGSAADPGLIALAETVAGRWAAAFAADGDPDAWLERLAAHSTPALADRLATPQAYRAGQALAPATVDGVAVGEAVAGRVEVTVTVTADDDAAHRLSLVVVGDADAAAVAEVRL